MFGEMIPVGGGDPIPFLKKSLLVGRRESCDIVLRFSNVSAHHCQLILDGGYWYVKDLKSRNGIKVNGVRVQQKRIDPGDELSVAKHRYEIKYSPHEQGAVGPPPPETETESSTTFSASSCWSAPAWNAKRRRRMSGADVSTGSIDLDPVPGAG